VKVALKADLALTKTASSPVSVDPIPIGATMLIKEAGDLPNRGLEPFVSP